LLLLLCVALGVRKTKSLEAAQELHEAAKGDGGEAKNDYKEELRRLKKASSNSLILSSMLLHNWNFFNTRLILLCGWHLWQEQAYKVKDKRTGEEDLKHSLAVATGGGQIYLKQLWRHVTGDSQQLARLGLAVALIASHRTCLPRSIQTQERQCQAWRKPAFPTG
jgi:hypothetical protein